MIKRVLIVGVVIFSIGTSLRASDIYSLIREGKFIEANDSLSLLTTASLRDGNVLFFRALLEPNGEESVRLMKAALKASVDPVYQEEIYYHLAHYYFITNQFDLLGGIVNEYRARWEYGKYKPEMLRFSVAMDQITGASESAIRQVDRYLLENKNMERYQWGVVDKARVMMASGKKIGSVKLLKELSREKSGPGVAPALYLLAGDAIEKKNVDNAVFYYNILREGYPSAVGLDAIIDNMSEMSSEESKNIVAEKRTGTYYSVQVGVFAENDNAKKQADIFKKYDKKVDIKKKKIADKTYRVVYVGRFQTYLDALNFKKILETNHKETFQVVAR